MPQDTHDDARTFMVSKLGHEFGAAFQELCNEFAWLYLKWHQYQTLFGEHERRIDILNSAAPLFFRLVQDVFWEDTLLHLARLTDPAQTGSKRNLSIAVLTGFVDNANLTEKLSILIKEAHSATGFARDWRNRHIAHRDLALALNEPTTGLASASRLLVTEAIRSVAAVLNAVGEHYLESTIEFDTSGEHGDAHNLLYVLQRGVLADQQRRRRLKEGNPLPEDLEHKEI